MPPHDAEDPEVARAADLLAVLGPVLPRLASPALIVDLAAVDDNIAAILRRCPADRWRPHVKTLKSAALIRRLWSAGVTRCKCATLDELQLLLETAAEDAREDSLDVLVAYPLHPGALRAVRRLCAAHPRARVALLADSPDHAAALAAELALAESADGPLRVHLDVDLGMARTGSPPAAWSAAVARLAALPHLQIVGLHGYDGHLEWDQRAEAFAAYDVLCDLADDLTAAGLVDDDLELITSGTHSFGAALDHPRLAAGPWRHRISPGTVVLSDLRSGPAAAELGLVPAALVLARVISRGDGRVTLDAGSKAIAPDRPAPSARPLGWPGLVARGASEEHLPLAHHSGALPDYGAPLLLIPDHVCTTVNLYRECLVLRPGAPPARATIGAAGHRLFLEDPP